MAITLDYVDFATGNDYKGATFTDGAYTSATKTLTKAGAFTATKVNHYLYLESNDGGSIVAGYYKVADVTGAPNAVVLATDAGAGVDDDAAKCTQHDGTTTKPWRSLQGAFDLCTRNTTDGNQVNLKAGAAHVNAAPLDLATFIAGGALAAAAPLIVRGYTSAANDGGIGEIDCNGATMWAAATYDYIGLANLDIHTFGDNHGVQMDVGCVLYACEIHKGASSPSGKYLASLTGAGSLAIGCYIYDAGAGAARGLNLGSNAHVHSNYIALGTGVGGASYGIYAGVTATLIANIALCQQAAANGLRVGDQSLVYNNVAYNTAAGTAAGIEHDTRGPLGTILNNIVCGWSGAGGKGVIGVNQRGVAGYNAFYNNTAPYVTGDMTFIDLTANDVTLAADPFTDAANGDFSLTVAGKAALRSLGWPAAYLGAHANTDPHITIGPMQYGPTPAATGAVAISPAIGRFL